MRLLFRLVFLCLIATVTQVSAAEFPELEVPKTIDFSLVYPLVLPKNTYEVDDGIALGLDLSYQFYPWGPLGLTLGFGVFGAPLIIEGQRHVLASGSIQTGFVLRPLPDFYLDPRILADIGIGFSDLGKLEKIRAAYLAKAGLRFNIYRASSYFQDGDVSLVGSGSFVYHFSQLTNYVRAYYYEIGLGLRGSF